MYKNIAVRERIHDLAIELIEHEKESGINYTLGQLVSRLIMQEHKKVIKVTKNGKQE